MTLIFRSKPQTIAPWKVLFAVGLTFAPIVPGCANELPAPDNAVVQAPTVPAAPRGFMMTANTANSITLTWYRPLSSDVTGYKIFASPTKEGTYKHMATVTERTWTHTGLTPETTYFYKVSAINAVGESTLSPITGGFTIKPIAATPFPVKIAKNMCVSLDAQILSSPAPAAGKLEYLVDGSDATSTTINGECEVRIKLNTKPTIDDAEYLLLNFRTDMTGQGYAYNINWRSLKHYVITESHDSTDGKDGTWTEVVSGTNKYLDGVVVIPNHKPKWIGIKNSGGLQLCRLDIFRSAPKGFRNDYWIFTGDSLVVQDLMGGSPERHTVWFSDLVRERYPDRYPIVVNSSQGGEMMEHTFGRLKATIAALSPENGTDAPTATILCWESGFNDVGLAAGFWMGKKLMTTTLDQLKKFCDERGITLVPVRIQFATQYLNLDTLEPAKDNIFHNTLAVNLGGIDVFARESTPYAVDPKTQLPYADYWTYTRENYATALGRDGVHHTKEGSDSINRLWVDVAGKMVYSRSSTH